MGRGRHVITPCGGYAPKADIRSIRLRPRQRTLRNLRPKTAIFAGGWFVSTTMAPHLPRLLEALGATPAEAIAAGALIGPAQVGARLIEVRLLRRVSPLVSPRLATGRHPIATALLALMGAPAAFHFTILHGSGNGLLTIARHTTARHVRLCRLWAAHRTPCGARADSPRRRAAPLRLGV
jgi:hypothetical protein